MPKRSESTITGTNRPTMGTTAQSLGAVPSAQDVKPGMLVPKSGNAKGGADPGGGTATHRGQTSAQATLGAQYRITASRGPWSETNSAIQANGRIVPAVTGSQRNFRGAQANLT